MFKNIFKYLCIGILVGVGIGIGEQVAFLAHAEEREKTAEMLKTSVEELKKVFYVMPGEDLFGALRGFGPDSGLSVEVLDVNDKGDDVVVSAVLSNQGNHIWQTPVLELELYDQNSKFMNECQREDVVNISMPGDKESFQISCSKASMFNVGSYGKYRLWIKNAHFEKTLVPAT